MRGFAALLMALCLSFWFPAAQLSAAQQEPLEVGQEARRLVLAGSLSSAPFEFRDENGEPAGLFVDYWRLWSQTTGIEIDYRLLPWQETMEAVLEGEADAVAAIFYSDSRDERFDFTQPYFTIATHVFLRKDDTDYQKLEDLRHKRMGVVQGDLAQEYLEKRLPDLDLQYWPTHDALIQAAMEGKLDAFASDTRVAMYHLQAAGGQELFVPVDEALYVSRVHAAVKQGNNDVLNLLNQGMHQVPHEHMELLVAKRLSGGQARTFPWSGALAVAGGLVLLVLLVAFWNRLLQRRVRQALQAVEKSERRFREIFDNSFQYMALLDTEGRVQRLNNAVLQRLPYEEDCQGMPFWEIPGWRENPRSHPELRKALIAAAGGQVARLELEVGDARGQLYLDITIKPLRNDKGQVELLIAEARDLSARKKVERELQAMRDTLQERVEERTAELQEAMKALQLQNDERRKVDEALHSSEEKYRLLVENAGEGIVVLQGRTLRYCNPKIVELSGYSHEELVGQPFIELVHPEDRAMVVENYQTRLSGGNAPEKYDFRIIDRYGQVRWLEIVAVRFEWEGAPATLNLLNDISQRKQAEEAMFQAKKIAEDASRIMSDFVSMVSHELRTPMTSVLGFARLIQKDFQRFFMPKVAQDEKLAKKAARIEDNLQIIIDESDRLSMLINDVLDLAKLESDRYEWHFEDTPLELIIDQALNATSPLFLETDVRTEREIDPELPAVPCDRKSLVQVLVNLLANAAKFTDQGHVCITAAKAEHEALVSVCDTGCGIPDEEQGRIFERFQQAGEMLTGKPRGTGLGLSICKEIVTRHGGRIWVESTPGQGSCFHFTLPLVEKDVVDEVLNRG